MSALRRGVVLLALATSFWLWPAAAPVGRAGTEESDPFGAPLESRQVAQRFRSCGYRVSGPSTGSWSPRYVQHGEVHFLGFGVSDDDGLPRYQDGRVLVVWVFEDETRATVVHLDAHLRSEQDGHLWRWSDDDGPKLAAGLGASVWRGNVALMQMTSMVGTRPDGSPGLPRFHDLPRDQAPYGVDRDFVECLMRPA